MDGSEFFTLTFTNKMDTPTCAICRDDVIDHPAPHATGSHRSSCGHVFHPSCIWKWFEANSERTCPTCRQKATTLEDLPTIYEEEEEEEEEAEEDVDEHSELLGLSRANMEYVLRTYGGIGVTYEVAVDVDYDLFGGGEAPISRGLLEKFLQEQGGRKLSDSQWWQLVSIYPYYPEEDEMEALAAPPQLTFGNSGVVLNPEDDTRLVR